MGGDRSLWPFSWRSSSLKNHLRWTTSSGSSKSRFYRKKLTVWRCILDDCTWHMNVGGNCKLKRRFQPIAVYRWPPGSSLILIHEGRININTSEWKCSVLGQQPAGKGNAPAILCRLWLVQVRARSLEEGQLLQSLHMNLLEFH